MIIALSILRVFGLAFLYRCRGGLLSLGETQLARIVYWAIPCGLLGLYQYGYKTGAIMSICAFLSLLIPDGWAQGDIKLIHVLGNSLIGFARSLILFGFLVYLNYFSAFVCLIGLLEGAAYYIGWKFLHGKPFKLFGLTIATGGTEYGELITGALYGVMFSLLT